MLNPTERSGGNDKIELSLKLSLNIDYTGIKRTAPPPSKIQWSITVWLNKKGIMQEQLIQGPLSARTQCAA